MPQQERMRSRDFRNIPRQQLDLPQPFRAIGMGDIFCRFGDAQFSSRDIFDQERQIGQRRAGRPPGNARAIGSLPGAVLQGREGQATLFTTRHRRRQVRAAQRKRQQGLPALDRVPNPGFPRIARRRQTGTLRDQLQIIPFRKGDEGIVRAAAGMLPTVTHRKTQRGISGHRRFEVGYGDHHMIEC